MVRKTRNNKKKLHRYHLGCCCHWVLLIIAMSSLKNSVSVIFNLWAILIARYPYIYAIPMRKHTCIHSHALHRIRMFQLRFRLVWLVTFACLEVIANRFVGVLTSRSIVGRYAFVTVSRVKRSIFTKQTSRHFQFHSTIWYSFLSAVKVFYCFNILNVFFRFWKFRLISMSMFVRSFAFGKHSI